jgi:WD40 repeat protein
MVIRADPFTKTTTTIMDLSRPSESFVPGGVKISTLTATHGVLIAGGFNGEYALASLQAERGTKHIEGCVTSHENGITNHVHTYRSRTSDHPYAVFSSNDQKIRILDCYSNRFLKTHSFCVPVNCSATSPDSRLRVVVGDHTQILIVDAESGEMVERLDGHSDFGFACAWADDGRHVATGNQDMQVRIYDARNWSQPLKLIPTEMAGCRSLRFSPVGGGKRVLVIAEPADIVSVVDADLFETKQNIDFFGEIGGVSFTPDGRDLFIANMDPKVGGVMEFERSGYGGQYGMRKHRRQEIEDMGDIYVPEEGWDWLEDEDLIWDPRVKWSRNHMRRRGLPLGEVLF